MKYLVFSDIHAKSTLRVFKGELPNRLKIIEKSMDFICECIQKYVPDFICDLGDLVHENSFIDALTVDLLDRKLSDIKTLCDKLSVKYYYVLGNHDRFSADGTIKTIAPFRKYFTALIDKPKIIVIDGQNIGFLPYAKLDQYRKNLNDMYKDSKIDILFTHIDIFNAPYSPGFIAKKGISIDEFKCDTWNGHHHVPSFYSNKNGNDIQMVGALVNHNFKDYYMGSKRACYLCDNRTIFPICNPHTEYYTSITYSDSSELKKMIKDGIPANKIHVSVINDGKNKETEKLLESHKFASKVIVKQNKTVVTVRSDINASMKPYDVISNYISEKKESIECDLNDLESVGLNFLSGQDNDI